VDEVEREWLTAFNFGESHRIRAFYRERMDDPDAAFAIDTAAATCGFLARLPKREPGFSFTSDPTSFASAA